MTKKIFQSILLTSLVVLLVGLAVAVGSLYHYFEDVQQSQLKTELSLAAHAVEDAGAGYLDDFETEGLRLTLVAKDGVVIADTDSDPATMENHRNREEVAEALAQGVGESSRYSSTLTEKTIYCAVLLDDGSVLRASVGQATVLALVADVVPWFVLAAVFAALLSWVLARRLSKRIIAPLNQVDLDRPLENDTYEELSPLLGEIHRQRERIKAQLSQLKQKTDEFDHITANMKEGLVLLDAHGRVLSINQAAMRLFGVTEAAVGTGFLTVERSHHVTLALDSALSEGYASVREERGGRSYQLDMSRIDNDGEAVGLVILIFDISEQEYAERTRREFTANVSHELKTPLTSIIASADLIENNLVKPEDMPRFVGHIKKESSRLLNLIEDIIRLSQLDEGADMPVEAVDLGELAKEVVEQLESTAKNCDVEVRLDAESCVVTGVPRLLHEIIYNLTENAIKYNVVGGSVAVSVSKSEEGVVLKVSDTGIGISQEHQERVFERFYRVDKSHSKQTGGTGLGLSIVKHAAARCGATIRMASEQDVGTAVTVVFPVLRQGAA